MSVEFPHSSIDGSLNKLSSAVQRAFEAFEAGFYDDSSEYDLLTEIHHAETSKACQLVHMNVKFRV